MDFELDWSFQTLTDNMAASMAPTTTNVSSSTSTTITSSLSTTTATHICHNFQELCRSCGKINAELYDLFQTTNSTFNTSSATCYTHLSNSISCTSTTTTTANKPSSNTAVGCVQFSTDDSTFDSVAATAKATAKGQSNMDNILQEMQIWQLKIKCNDGLPQRICAKCTAQFYMIHKFRRKCLKVQTQLRALNEEQNFYERQQEKENPTTAKDAIPSATSKAEVATETAPLVEANDLLNDNCGEQQAAVDNTKSAVSFVTNTGNTNTECIAAGSTRATTLLNNVETMPQKTEANEPTTPTSSAAPVFSDKKFETQEHCTFTRRPKDEKKPLLKAAVLNFIKTPSPPLTLQQSSEQICDNDATDHTNPSKKLCLAQESMLDRHMIFKTSARPNKTKQQGGDLKPYQHKDEKMLDEDAQDKDEANETFNLSINPQSPLASKSNPESLFLTKAALKAYTASSNELNTKAGQHVTPAIEATNSNDSNNAHSSNLSSDHCDRLSQDNHCESTDNTCSSTSSSTQSPCCSSKSSSISRKSHRTRGLRHKAVKYAGHNKRSGHCYKSSDMPSTKKMTKMTLKKKQRSWQNKHKSKRLADIRTCLSKSALRKCRQSKQHKMNNGKKHRPQQSELQMEDETSSTVSATSSSSSSAYTSPSYSSATTPAVTDLVENHTLYCKNANENLHKTGSLSTAQGISSNKSCIMWKTKAAMKANANDMPVAVFVDNKAGPTSYTPAISSLKYTASATATGSASALLSLSLATENSDNSSKTLDENQSISISTNINHNNNNILMEEQHHCSTNTVLSSPDNQVKDTEDESEQNQNLNHNLWPEEADQKQINANNNQANEDENEEDEQNVIVETKSETEEFNATKAITEQEKLEEVDEEADKQQKPTVLTPKTGGMKLIIQRKRGARFKCRRKTDDDPSDNHDNHKTTTHKRRKRSSQNTNLQSNLGTESLFLVDVNGDYFKQDEELTQTNKQKSRYFDDSTLDSDIEENVNNNNANRKRKVPEFNSEEDENKENPIALQPDFESDSNNSVYRDPLLIRNDMLEDDTQLTDFPKPQLSLQTECSKEMYKLYKEKINLESPKKLIVRVPLTSLTQDFKRLHLTMDKKKQESEPQNETTEEELPLPVETNEQKTHNETLEIQTQEEETAEETNISSQANTSSSQSDLLGFSQNSETSSSTVDSSQSSIDMVRYIQPPLCTASSKINDFINDFQNNCIDSSEIEETCDMIPQLGPRITQELSDEIRDVEDTLNGILSEMHDKDLYNPRSAETDEFFPNSVYSPLTDSPTTPAHSFYAESPCTINSNPMSVSPFIHHNMDYNAMTPQSNHSSMGHGSHMGSGGSTGPLAVVFSEHIPTYTECFEESTQSELIGFQNDIPCFENIESINPDTATDILTTQGEFNEEGKVANVADTDSNAENIVTENVEVKAPTEIVDYIDLSDYKEDSEQLVDTPTTQIQVKVAPEITVSNTDILPNQMPYNPANYQQLNNTPTIQIQNSANRIISTNTNTQPHYIVTNTNQGPIIIANPQLNQTAEQMDGTFKPHSNNLQFVTLGQAMEANQAATNRLIHNHATEINWPNAVNASTSNYNQQPVVSAANGTTTYFINANGELYQASIPSSSLNTIIVPNNTAQATFNKSNMDNNENFMQTLHQQRQQQNNSGQSSQYIMLVNNLGGTPQYYATTHTNLNQTVQPQQPAVLFQRTPQTHNIHNDSDFITNSQQQSNTNSITEPNPPAPASEKVQDPKSGQTMHQRVNQQLQKQIKQRQLQLLQPRSPNVTQKITLICRFCHKRPKFTNNVDYSNHIINTHPAEMPYNCPHCPMRFTRRFERQQHVEQVHGSRYQCAQCGLIFFAQRTLDFHLQKYHANLGRSQPHLQQQEQQQQQNSTSTSTPATYQLLQHNKRQRLVRVEDVHVQVTGENKNKRSIDLTLDGSADIQTSQSMPEVEILSDTTGMRQLQQQSRKLCSPDCNNDNDDCCCSNKNYDQLNNNNNTQAEESEHYAGSESVNNNQHNRQHHQQHQYQHVTIPQSPEQTEPDSTTTLRHFRKRQLSDKTPHFATSPTSSSFSNSNASNDNLNHNSPDNVLAGGGGSGAGAGEQIVVERSLRGSHNCLLCEESFTNEIALRKHHHLAHGATQTQTTNTAAILTGLVCTICKRGFRMRNALQRHMETHDAEGRPYECNICQVRFPRPSQLTLHKLTVHKFEKPISCEECGKQFGTESAMKAHAEEHHPYGEEAGSATTASSEASSSLSA